MTRRTTYALGMFPYPSGTPHLGHVLVYSITDTVARHATLTGRDVLHPIGWDAFGLPAENAARARGVDPAAWTATNIERMRATFCRMGWRFDWDREICTSDPSYYRFTQWLFLQLWHAGLAEIRPGWVNWCEDCGTTLANEQAVGGVCWRCNAPVVKRRQPQWTFRITAYADRLWEGLNTLQGWDPRAVATQRHWIGRSEGATVRFGNDDTGHIEVFTTRADTLMGVVAVVVAPEHPWAQQSQDPAVQDYVARSLVRSQVDRASTGTATGLALQRTVTHPLTGQPIGVWVADYVLGDYGTGAVMCVPAHDDRDHAFATAMGLPVIRVVGDDDVLVSSGPFTGMTATGARPAIASALHDAGAGGPTVATNLRDWSVGRQRQWGCPIPMVHCDECGPVAVPEAELPVRLDDPPQRACPACGAPARRESDTLDTFVCSAWYAFRFCDPHNTERAFDPEAVAAAMPVATYVGGLEHAAQHMLYFRFVTHVLHDLGHVPFTEPVQRFVCNGMVLGHDGTKMSKNRGNGVDPEDVLNTCSADALRLAVLADTPVQRDRPFDPEAPHHKDRFLRAFGRRIDGWLADHAGAPGEVEDWPDAATTQQLAERIRRLADAYERVQLHVATALVHELDQALRPVFAAEGHRPAANALLRSALTALWPLVPSWVQVRWPQAYGVIDHWPQLPHIVPTQRCVVQIDGRRVTELSLPDDATEERAVHAALQQPQVRSKLGARTVVRTVWIRGRILNLVCA